MTVCGIATIPERTAQLKNTLDSICPQVDVVYVYQNGKTNIEVPGNVVLITGKDLGDAGKFWPMFSEVKCDIFFSVDDDLIYPPDYVETLKAKINAHNCIITCHGRTFNHHPIKSYYRDYAMKLRCLDQVHYDTLVQFGGTGAMAFKPEYFRPNHFPTSNMADIHVAIQAKKEGKKIIAIEHQAGWIKYQQVENTIFERFKFDDAVQTGYVNSIAW